MTLLLTIRHFSTSGLGKNLRTTLQGGYLACCPTALDLSGTLVLFRPPRKIIASLDSLSSSQPTPRGCENSVSVFPTEENSCNWLD